MKTVKKELSIRLEEVTIERPPVDMDGMMFTKVTFCVLGAVPNLESLTAFVEVQEPETIKEFREENNLSKEELIEWLNKNYKK